MLELFRMQRCAAPICALLRTLHAAGRVLSVAPAATGLKGGFLCYTEATAAADAADADRNTPPRTVRRITVLF